MNHHTAGWCLGWMGDSSLRECPTTGHKATSQGDERRTNPACAGRFAPTAGDDPPEAKRERADRRFGVSEPGNEARGPSWVSPMAGRAEPSIHSATTFINPVDV